MFPLFRCFPYSYVRYSDPHCTGIKTVLNIFKVENMIKLSSKSTAHQISETSKRDTKTLMNGLSQSVHNSVGNHLEREVKSMAPFVAQMTAENIHQHLTKEVRGHSLKPYTWSHRLVPALPPQWSVLYKIVQNHSY